MTKTNQILADMVQNLNQVLDGLNKINQNITRLVEATKEPVKETKDEYQYTIDHWPYTEHGDELLQIIRHNRTRLTSCPMVRLNSKATYEIAAAICFHLNETNETGENPLTILHRYKKLLKYDYNTIWTRWQVNGSDHGSFPSANGF